MEIYLILINGEDYKILGSVIYNLKYPLIKRIIMEQIILPQARFDIVQPKVPILKMTKY